MKHMLAWLLVFVAGCAASGPAAPPLAATITLTEPDYEERGGLLPITGVLTMTVNPDGGATSICKRQIFTDVERKGDLSNSERWELHTKAEAWAAKAGTEAPAGKPYGTLTYGRHRASWEQG